MAKPAEITAYLSKFTPPPPPGSPHALPIPGSEREGRTPIYRHFRVLNTPLLETVDPSLRTYHDLFEFSAKHGSRKPLFGRRPWDAATKSWENRFVWMTFAEGAERRKNIGAGLVELHRRIGIPADKYGVGLWAQNCAEWHLVGMLVAVDLSPWID